MAHFSIGGEYGSYQLYVTTDQGQTLDLMNGLDQGSANRWEQSLEANVGPCLDRLAQVRDLVKKAKGQGDQSDLGALLVTLCQDLGV